MRLAPTLLALSLLGGLAAQSGRYRDQVFPFVDVRRDVIYGWAVNRNTQQHEDLRLDLYQPAGDPSDIRAAIVVVHGGGFHSGDKSDTGPQQIAHDLAGRGFIAISINYRLGPTTQPPEVAARDAAHDFKAAVRWLRANADWLDIDPTRIGCIGNSAGAITCCEAAYVSDEGESGNAGYSSDVGAVVDLWGFLTDPTELGPGETPVQVIHGIRDAAVPFLHGVLLNDRAKAVGVATELWPVDGGHEPWAEYFADYHKQAVGFFYEHLVLAQLNGLTVRHGYRAPGTITLDTVGNGGDYWALFVSVPGTPIDLGPWGVLHLSPVGLAHARLGRLPENTRLATSAFARSVPPDLRGVELVWQAIHLTPAGIPRQLTNPVYVQF